jgi:FKBP-type peptidyl-prolyl cis-trans isomerase
MPAKSTLSYAIGMSIGKELTNATKRLQLIIDTDTMLGAMRDVLDGKPTHMTEKELEEIGRAATAPTRKNADNEETKARGDAATSMPDKSKLSYAIGMSFGREATSRFMTHQFPVDTGTVLEALRDVVDGKPARLTEQELSDILDQRSDAIQARRKPQK